MLLLGLAVLLIGAFFAGYIPLQRRDALVRAEEQEREKELPHMEVMRVGRSSIQSELKLPGTLQAVTEAPILARADGYLKSRFVDLGDRVKAGQPLAEIDAPELDQQIRQAEAAVDQAQASLEQAQASLEQGKSSRGLAQSPPSGGRRSPRKASSRDRTTTSIRRSWFRRTPMCRRSKKRLWRSAAMWPQAKANVARLQEVQGYRVVKAPFDGVIILRNVDVGALVTTGTTLLYRIAQTETLRTYVNVPQDSASFGPPGPGCPVDALKFSRPPLPRQGRAYGERAGSGQPNDAGRSRRAEQRWRSVPRHVCAKSTWATRLPIRLFWFPPRR